MYIILFDYMIKLYTILKKVRIMILESFIVVSCLSIASRMVHTKVENDKQVIDKILSDGIYHITSLDNANKIIDSGHITPSSNLISLGRKKCFFFAGTPNYDQICSNCANSATKYEFYAIKVIPNKEELSLFKQRSLNDGAITFLGKCDLPKDRANIVQMVFDLDKDNKVISREKTEEEIENGDYIPSKMLLEKLKLSNNKKLEMVEKLGGAYIKEFGFVGKKISSVVKDVFRKIYGEKTLMLDTPKEDKIVTKNEDSDENKFIASLKQQIISEESIIKTCNSEKVMQQKKKMNFEYKLEGAKNIKYK